jgi:hypothetical protein
MSYTISWYDKEHTILCVDVTGRITWQQWHQISDDLIAQCQPVDHRVDIIFLNGTGFPPGNPLPHLKTAGHKFAQHKHIGMLVNISNRSFSGFMKTFAELIARASGNVEFMKQGAFVNTFDEALEFIEKVRAEQVKQR